MMAAAVVVFVVFPVLNLVVPPGNPFHVSAFGVTLGGKIMCYMIVAIAMDLVWGYAGILSLGHGLFFALGGYAFGMYLMRQIGADGQYRVNMPDFMVFLDWKEFPWAWWNSDSFLWAIFLVVAVPGMIAFVFGYFAFRSRVKGVYFSIITQALTYAAMLLFFRNATGFGGNNGFTDFKRILGIPITTPEMRMTLFALTGRHADRHAAARALARHLEVRARARRDPRRRVARDVLRLRHALVQALRLDALGDALRHRGRALRAAGRHHQPERDVAGQLDRDRDLGGGRRARHAGGPDRRRGPGERREERLHRGAARVLALRAAASSSSWSRSSCPRGRRARAAVEEELEPEGAARGERGRQAPRSRSPPVALVAAGGRRPRR